MTAIQVGPLAFPTGPLLWLAALWLAQWLAARLGGEQGKAASTAVWLAALAGFASARLAFVAGAAPAYMAAPWSVLDLRDGGWSPWAGVAAALAVLGWQAWRQRPLARPLGAAAAAGALVWGCGSLVLGLHQPPPLPALTLYGLQGEPAELQQLAQGQPTVINLWAAWCAPCRAEMPAFAAAQQQWPGVRFLFVNQGESVQTVQRFLASRPYALNGVWLDTDSQLGPAVGSTGLPTTLFVDARGRIVERHFGMLSAASLGSRVSALQAAAAAL